MSDEEISLERLRQLYEEERRAREAAEKRIEEERRAREAAKQRAEEERQAREAAEQGAKEEKRAREAAEQGAKEATRASAEQDAAANASSVIATPLRSRTPIKNSTPIQNAQKCSLSMSVSTKRAKAQAIEHEIHQNIHTIWFELDLYEAFFQRHTQHLQAAQQIFAAFSSGRRSFHNGKTWLGWPKKPSEKKVVPWLKLMVNRITKHCKNHPSLPAITRHLVSTSSSSLGFTSNTDYKPDCMIVDTTVGHVSNWSQVVAVIELKENGTKDPTSTWLQVARYAWELFNNQCNRRFVLALSIIGSNMQIWSFDRLGMLGSSKIDINHEGEKFLSVLLGFLTIDPSLVGFDPTMKMLDNGKRAMDVLIDGEQQRVILDDEIAHYRGIVTRGTICWRAHFEGVESKTLVIKDSWQVPERQEGELLRRLKSANIANIPRFLDAYPMQFNGRVDDVFGSIRNNIDATCGNSRRVKNEASLVNHDHSTTTTSVSNKRRMDNIDEAGQPSAKRQRRLPVNRVHQRVILGDVCTRIEEEESLNVLLICIAQCIEAHKMLLDSHILHRDISPGNILINQDRSDPSRLGLLIDLDYAADTNRSSPSGLAVRTGTFLFMSINILSGANNFKHSFMDDLESFFWVLFWLCLNPDSTLLSLLEETTCNPDGLSIIKRGIVANPSLESALKNNCAPRYVPLIPCVLELLRVVFPNGCEWRDGHEDHGLYEKMKDILKKHSEIVARIPQNGQDAGEQKEKTVSPKTSI